MGHNTLCSKCDFYFEGPCQEVCKSPVYAVTGSVNEAIYYTHCSDMNKIGSCKYFEAKPNV